MSSVNPAPSSTIIALDIDYTMWIGKESVVSNAMIKKKMLELFPNEPFSNLNERKVMTHFFPKAQTDNLNKIIEVAKSLGEVHILLSSAWRQFGTIGELRYLFGAHEFSKYLVDKTFYELPISLRPVDYVDLSTDSLKKYNFRLLNRGQQIDYWLRENNEKYNIKRLVILDDEDDGISYRFGKFFAKINGYNLIDQILTEKAIQIIKEISFSKESFPVIT